MVRWYGVYGRDDGSSVVIDCDSGCGTDAMVHRAEMVETSMVLCS